MDVSSTCDYTLTGSISTGDDALKIPFCEALDDG